MGKILLNQLSFCTIIGTLPHERLYPQRLFMDVEIDLDMSRAAQTDDLGDALDYSAVEREIAAVVEGSSFQLLEALLKAAADVIISHETVRSCKVRITKPEASACGRSVAVEAEFNARGMIR